MPRQKPSRRVKREQDTCLGHPLKRDAFCGSFRGLLDSVSRFCTRDVQNRYGLHGRRKVSVAIDRAKAAAKKQEKKTKKGSGTKDEV